MDGVCWSVLRVEDSGRGVEWGGLSKVSLGAAGAGAIVQVGQVCT